MRKGSVSQSGCRVIFVLSVSRFPEYSKNAPDLFVSVAESESSFKVSRVSQDKKNCGRFAVRERF